MFSTTTGAGTSDLSEDSDVGKFRFLSKFAMEWKRLQVGGALLPDLVEFYTWLHKTLAYMLTREKASSITIGSVITLLEKLDIASGTYDMRKLYERVMKQYNCYVEEIGMTIGEGACGALNREKKIEKIKDDQPIIKFLTG